MNADIGLSNTAFGFGAGIFFIGYVLFQIPSNIALTRYGPRRWIGTIAVIWGAIAALMATIHGATEFYVLRFVLGAVEAGLFPGILFYLTLWFPLQQRGRVTAMLVVAGSTSPLIGAPLSTWLMEFVDGRIGLHGWQLMFIIESVPAILLGFWCLYRMPNGPADVRWLAGWRRSGLAAGHARRRACSDPASLRRNAKRSLGVFAAGHRSGLHLSRLRLRRICDRLLSAAHYRVAECALSGWTEHRPGRAARCRTVSRRRCRDHRLGIPVGPQERTYRAHHHSISGRCRGYRVCRLCRQFAIGHRRIQPDHSRRPVGAKRLLADSIAMSDRRGRRCGARPYQCNG
ncbi:MFS transporter [Paraburkholderia tropica]|uniref:MFS transporter n=1 Tax=Paraburkholderia tropica TaxID=92647 RepID=UPI0035D492FA